MDKIDGKQNAKNMDADHSGDVYNIDFFAIHI